MITITQQPASNSLNSAYRPIVIKGTFPTLTGVINLYSVTIGSNGNSAAISPAPPQSVGLGTIINFDGNLKADITVATVTNFGAAILVTFPTPIPLGTYTNISLTVNGVASTYTGPLPPPPVAFCDVYINGTYYKTLSDTSSGFNPMFDIQDAVKEKLSKYLGVNGSSIVRAASPLFATCFGRIRGSSTDPNGFLIAESAVPIQATGGTPAVAGGGTSTNTFFVVNSTLQHEDNQDLASHYNLYKTRTWDSQAYPLSHRVDGYKVTGSDYFPLINLNTPDLTKIKIFYSLRAGGSGNLTNSNVFPSCPIVTGITVTPTDNNNGIDQTFTFTWNTPDPLLTGINVLYTLHGGSTFTSVPLSTVSGQILVLPLDKYDFKFEMVGSCTTTTSSLTSNVGINPPACVVPTHSSPALPDGFVGVPYVFDLSVSGSQPFNLTGVTKPSWMTITVAAGTVQLRGTPTAIGTGITAAFTVNNACGTVPYSDTFNVTNLARTLTFSFTQAGYPLYDLNSQLRVELNAPVDSFIVIASAVASGRSSNDCSGAEVVNSRISNYTLQPGDVLIQANDTPAYQWGFCNSYRISEAKLRLNLVQTNPISVFPGQVITVGSYSVTIIFNGC